MQWNKGEMMVIDKENKRVRYRYRSIGFMKNSNKKKEPKLFDTKLWLKMDEPQ